MKISRLILGVVLSVGFASCNNDDSIVEEEPQVKSYELASLQWKLKSTDGQSIIEKKVPEFYFRNDSDTIMPVVIEPLKNLNGSSKFNFNDSLAFAELNYAEAEVSIPKELSLLSERYRQLGGGINAPLKLEESSFPFSRYHKDSTGLNKNSQMTSNYTIFLRKNTASFLATFREMDTGGIFELEGTWTGLFFNNLEEKSVISEIE
ncbi:hypothetical protein [uncultured Salegentibacter sp.]|uniref:hypothetical protein n=1 Tax=uncultured Salegentibacter sp. TaxID=259320 RepID=UPI0030D76DAB